MPAPVSRQKINLPSLHLSADDRVGRITEWRFDALLRGIFDALHLIKAAAADDADCGKVLIHVAQASSLRTDQRKLEAFATLILFGATARLFFVAPSAEAAKIRDS